MSLPRESGRVETDRIVWQEWICESEVNGFSAEQESQ